MHPVKQYTGRMHPKTESFLDEVISLMLQNIDARGRSALQFYSYAKLSCALQKSIVTAILSKSRIINGNLTRVNNIRDIDYFIADYNNIDYLNNPPAQSPPHLPPTHSHLTAISPPTCRQPAANPPPTHRPPPALLPPSSRPPPAPLLHIVNHSFF
jgi:hypothetical protein